MVNQKAAEKDFQMVIQVIQKAAGKDSEMGYQKAAEMVGQMATEKDSQMVNQKAAGKDSEMAT